MRGERHVRTLVLLTLFSLGCGGNTPLGPKADDEPAPKEPPRKTTLDNTATDELSTEEPTSDTGADKRSHGGYDTDALDKRIEESLSQLSAEDRKLAEAQKHCPVGVEFDDDGKPTGGLLGSIGKPVRMEIEGQTVFIACPSCVEPFKEDTANYMEVLAKIRASREKSGTEESPNQ